MNKIDFTKKFISVLLAGTTVFALAGCNKKMKCDVEGSHAHRYVTAWGYSGYANSEYEDLYDGCLKWTDTTTDEVSAEEDFMTKHGNVKIEDNLEQLREDVKDNLPYVEYEYKYISRGGVSLGGKGFMPTQETSYRYSTDPDILGATGIARDVKYKYEASRVITDEDGELDVEYNSLVDNLEDIKNDYPYFNVRYYDWKSYSDLYEVPTQKVKK